MLSLSPGELSTFVGPLTIAAEIKTVPILAEQKPFNPRDLPCPPQSVMVGPRSDFRHGLR